MDTKRIISSTQEQAIAEWNQYMACVRLNKLAEELAKQDQNFNNAIEQFNILRYFISNTSHILGNEKTKYGEIAEHVHVRFSNAEDYIVGNEASHSLDVGRLNPEDYLRNGKMVQSKFYNSPKGTLGAIISHLKKYPDFIKNNGEYDIPKEQYEILKDIYNRGEHNRSSLGKSNYGNEESLYRTIKEFESNNNVKFNDVVKPAKTTVKDVQLYTVESTIQKEEQHIVEKNEEINQQLKDKHSPKVNDFAKATLVSAVAEGTTTFIFSFYKKKKERKEISKFTNEDWIQIFEESGISVIKGSVRGSALFAITNYSTTPAPIANALITATFGMVTQSNLLANGKITNEEFIDNSELMCLDVSLSALSAMLGQTLIPIPVIGAIIGNTIGMFIEQITINYLNEKEAYVIRCYEDKIKSLYKKSYIERYEELSKKLQSYQYTKDLITLSFNLDNNNALSSTISLANKYGVKNEQLLLSDEETDNFFNDNKIIYLN